MPSLPGDAKAEGEELMPSIHRVIEYSGLDYYGVLELPCDLFLLMAKNSYVDSLRSTQEGWDYLDKCARMSITEPDYAGIKQWKQERGNSNGSA
ncbi:MAG: hypothetical protein RR994_05560 [Clostridia bacterium]